MLHLKFIIAWLYSPLGLYRSVEERLPVPTWHAVRYAAKKDKDAFLRNAGLGACMTISTERSIPDGMRFYMIRYNIEYLFKNIFIILKKLNRPIAYPFFVLGDFIIFDPPEKKRPSKKEFEEQYKIAQKENDSLKAIYNNANYYLTLDNRKDISLSVWDSLEIMIDSAKFWKTPPELYINYQQIDGSMWFLEGHFQSGYQIKRIPSPHFSPEKYLHKYDKEGHYADIFRFLIEKAGLEHENLY